MTHPTQTGWKGYHRFVWLLHCPSQEDRGHNQSQSTNLRREKKTEVYTSDCHLLKNTGCHLGITVSNCHLGSSEIKKNPLIFLKPAENHSDFQCCILPCCFTAGLWATGSFGSSAPEATLSFWSCYLSAFQPPFCSAELLYILFGKLTTGLKRSCVNYSIYKMIASD